MLFGKKKCKVCGVETKDCLTLESKQSSWYCRNHLIGEFEKVFLNTESRMLVCEPNYEVCKEMYSCLPIKQLTKFNFPRESVEQVNKIISRLDILNQCDKCGESAQSIYYDRRYFAILYPKSRDIYRKIVGTGPELENLPTDGGRLLCLKCVLEKIKPILKRNPGHFADWGLVAPLKEDCLYVSTYL